MLRQEELASNKAISNIEVFPVFLRGLAKAGAPERKKGLRPLKLTLRELRPWSVLEGLLARLGTPETIRVSM